MWKVERLPRKMISKTLQQIGALGGLVQRSKLAKYLGHCGPGLSLTPAFYFPYFESTMCSIFVGWASVKHCSLVAWRGQSYARGEVLLVGRSRRPHVVVHLL